MKKYKLKPRFKKHGNLLTRVSQTQIKGREWMDQMKRSKDPHILYKVKGLQLGILDKIKTFVKPCFNLIPLFNRKFKSMHFKAFQDLQVPLEIHI